jgi:hypothetical protein
MNWEALGAIGEMAGSLLVLLTLIYLAVQVRQVKNDLHISGYREINKMFSDTSATITPEVAKILTKITNGEELEGWENVLRDEYFFRYMNTVEITWEHERVNAIDVSSESALETISWYLRKPGLEQWWKENRGGYLDHWQQVVDRIYEENGGDA